MNALAAVYTWEFALFGSHRLLSLPLSFFPFLPAPPSYGRGMLLSLLSTFLFSIYRLLILILILSRKAYTYAVRRKLQRVKKLKYRRKLSCSKFSLRHLRATQSCAEYFWNIAIVARCRKRSVDTFYRVSAPILDPQVCSCGKVARAARLSLNRRRRPL